MKNICLVILLLPILSFGQNLSYAPIPNSAAQGSNLIHVTKTDNGLRVFTTEASTCGKLSMNGPDETKFNQFHVADYNQEGKIIDKKKYILYKNEFPSGNLNFKKGRTIYGTDEDIKSYKELVEMYPSLSEVDRIDTENRKYPDEFYKTSLKTNFSSRITGYKSQKMTKKPEQPKEEPKKGKGLIKITSSLSGIGGLFDSRLYETTDSQNLDWEDSYKGAHKKSYWISEYDASCQTTGKTIAYQAYQDKEDDRNRFRQKEIVAFDVNGNITNTIDVSNGKQWKTLAKTKNTKFSGGVGALQSVSIVEVEDYHKKKNPDAHPNTLRIQNISSSGDLSYSHIMDYPLEYGILDTTIVTDNGKTMVSGYIRKGSYFVTNCSSENCTTTYLGSEEKSYGKAVDMISTKQGDFAIFLKNKKEFNVFPLTEGNVEPMTIPVQSDEVIRAGFDYYESDQGLIFAFKDSSVGINKFRWEMTHVQLMQLKDSKLVPISNFEEDQFVLDANRSFSPNKFIELDGEIHMIGRIFKEDSDGKLRNYPALATFKL